MKEEVHLVQQSQQNIREELYDTDELSPDSLRKHIQFVVPIQVVMNLLHQ